jgi:hypothetical protein
VARHGDVQFNYDLPTWRRDVMDATVALHKVRPNSFTPWERVPVPEPTGRPDLEHDAAVALHRYAARLRPRHCPGHHAGSCVERSTPWLRGDTQFPVSAPPETDPVSPEF